MVPVKKKLAAVSILFLVLVSVAVAAESSAGSGVFTVINTCFSTPFCIKQGAQPSTNSEFTAGDNYSQEWRVNATGQRGEYDIRVFANSSNPNVGQFNSSNETTEIFAKGLIPDTKTAGHPFFIQSGDSNPQTVSGSFITGDSLVMSSMINATGATGNYTVFFFANSTNSNVNQQESSKQTVEITTEPSQEFTRNVTAKLNGEGNIDDRGFEPNRNVQDSSTGTDLFQRTSDVTRNFIESLQGVANILASRLFSANVQDQAQGKADTVTILKETTISVQDAAHAVDTIVRNISITRNFQDQLQGEGTSGIQKKTDISVSDTAQVKESVEASRQLFRNLIAQIEGFIGLSRNANPRINNLTLEVKQVGSVNRNLSFTLNLTDPNGDDEINSISYNGASKQIDTNDASNIVFDINDYTNQSADLVIEDEKGLQDKRKVAFDMTGVEYRQRSNSVNLTLQDIDINTTVNNDDSKKFWVNLSHAQLGGTFRQGGYQVKRIGRDTSKYFYSRNVGDFLNENTHEWRQDPTERSYMEKQFVRRPLNVSTDTNLTWENVSTGTFNAPSDMSPCDECDAENISFRRSYSAFEWFDTGDVLQDDLFQVISDVVIKEREEYWEEYEYQNQTSDVDWNRIVVNETIDDEEFIFGEFIRVRPTNTSKFVEFKPKVTDECGQPDAPDNVTVVDGKTFESCAKDTDGNDKVDFFELTWRDFNTDDHVRYGGFLGDPPSVPVADFEGQSCPEDDSHDLMSIDDRSSVETFSGDLVCVNGQLMDKNDIFRAQVSRRQNLRMFVAGLLMFATFITLFILVFSEDERIGGFLRRIEEVVQSDV